MTRRSDDMDDRDIDERFASIIAAWSDKDPTGDPFADPLAEPADESVDVATPDQPSPWPTADEADPPPPQPLPGPRDYVGVPEDEHFVPPAVTLPPQEDLTFWGAVGGMVGGPLVLLYAVIAQPHNASWWVVGAIMAFIAGFALMVLRLPIESDDDPTGGARV